MAWEGDRLKPDTPEPPFPRWGVREVMTVITRGVWDATENQGPGLVRYRMRVGDEVRAHQGIQSTQSQLSLGGDK
jgi:hypothetical protein